MFFLQKQENFFLLLFLAKKASLFNSIKTSTGKISKELNVSQQTVSRKLRDLKSQGLITLVSSPRGCEISIAENGIALVRKHFFELKKFFSKSKTNEIEGTVSFGLGEGRYYISQKPYLEQFKKLLGFKPFLGTLNLVVETEKLEKFLLNSKPIFIQGFSTKERSFGSLKAFKIKIFGVQGAIIIPERAKHQKNTVEIISPVFLRKKFGFKEKSKAKIMLEK